MKKRMGLVVFSLFVGLFWLSADPGWGAPAKKLVLNMGASSSPEHSRYKAADIFMAKVKKESKGQIEAVRMFGGVLGNETKMTQSVQAGTLEIGWISDIGISTVVPEIGFVNLPYLLPTYQDVDKKYFKGWMGDVVKKRIEAKGLHFLAWVENDYRWLTNSRREVLKPEDLKGLKIRTVETPMFIAFFKELGVMPTPMGITEVSTALQQKTVDGQDNGAILTYAYGFFQFQKYLTKTSHSYSGGAIIINKGLWESLTPEQKKIIQNAAEEAGKWQIEKNRQDVAEYLDKMKNAGVKITEITPELDKKFKEVSWSIMNNKTITARYGDDVMKRLLAEYPRAK
jgi:tripartite ATP-independent transporter DctP family solute receptor